MSIEIYEVRNDTRQWQKDLLAAPIGTEIMYIWKGTAKPYGSFPEEHKFKKIDVDKLENNRGVIYRVSSFTCGDIKNETGWAVVRTIDVVEELD